MLPEHIETPPPTLSVDPSGKPPSITKHAINLGMHTARSSMQSSRTVKSASLGFKKARNTALLTLRIGEYVVKTQVRRDRRMNLTSRVCLGCLAACMHRKCAGWHPKGGSIARTIDHPILPLYSWLSKPRPKIHPLFLENLVGTVVSAPTAGRRAVSIEYQWLLSHSTRIIVKLFLAGKGA